MHPDGMIMVRPDPVAPATAGSDLLVEADFDGNGVQDKAFWIVHERNAMPVAYMNEGKNAMALSGITVYGYGLSNLGLRLLPPGVYQSKCARQKPEVCSPLHLERHAIELVIYDRRETLWKRAGIHRRHDNLPGPTTVRYIYYWRHGHFHLYYLDWPCAGYVRSCP